MTIPTKAESGNAFVTPRRFWRLGSSRFVAIRLPKIHIDGATDVEELIGRIVQSAGISAENARRALGIILSFLRKEGPEAEVDKLIAALPGAADLVAEEDSAAPGPPGWMGKLGGLMGAGGLMTLADRLTREAGLGMDGIKTVAEEIFGFAREHVGQDFGAKVAESIPALKSFL